MAETVHIVRRMPTMRDIIARSDPVSVGPSKTFHNLLFSPRATHFEKQTHRGGVKVGIAQKFPKVRNFENQNENPKTQL